jgi:hypothetical protein
MHPQHVGDECNEKEKWDEKEPSKVMEMGKTLVMEIGKTSTIEMGKTLVMKVKSHEIKEEKTTLNLE